ncbi:2OG-Fe(II) oxygenase [Dyadobacter jiangsuensis]
MINIENLDWPSIRENLHERGYAQLTNVLDTRECAELIAQYDNPAHYRKTIVMERYRFGLGEYKYLSYPLPPIIQRLRESIFPKLVPVANQWMEVLKMGHPYPADFEDFQELCRAQGQTKPTVLILKYGKGGHNTLHQDLYGELFFPIQMVLFLNEPDEDYTGGEFVMTEQIPRAQSKAIVLKPRKGDALLFTTNFRPVKGSKGYYRINMKHGVSEVHNGQRYTLGIIFHDALN